MASFFKNQRQSLESEDEERSILQQGVIMAGQSGHDPTQIYRFPADARQFPKTPPSTVEQDGGEGYDADADYDYYGDGTTTASEFEESEAEPGTSATPAVTTIHAGGHRLLMKSGGLVSDEFKNLKRHPFVINSGEDPMRLLTPAEDHMTATFGGLVIGYQGDRSRPPRARPAASGSSGGAASEEDYVYRGFLFQPGMNLGPEFPGDFSMTPYCVPKTSRVRQIEDDEARRGQMMAKFSPVDSRGMPGAGAGTPTKDGAAAAGSGLGSGASVGGKSRTPTSAEGDVGGVGSGEAAKKDLNVFVFFGKPQPIPPIDCPPVFPTSDETVLDYVDEHNLEVFFEHLIALCVIDFHPNPYEFMTEYCDALIQARTDLEKFDTLLRVFYPTHVSAIYRLFDKQQAGFVTLEKYRVGMEVLGLNRYTPDPLGYHEDKITKETFFDEGCRGLELLLRSFMI